MHSTPATDVQSVITDAELADFLGVDETDTLLPSFAQSATSLVIEYLERELITRARTVVYNEWPVFGTYSHPSISPNNSTISTKLKLPYAGALSVESVTIGGDLFTDYQLMKGRPDYLQFKAIALSTDAFVPAAVIEYTAGYGAIGDVPQGIKSAVLMLAAYLYAHRGACDVGTAIKQSGAASMLAPYKMNMAVI